MPRRAEATANTAKFGTRLRDLRLSRNMSLGDLADTASLSKGHLSSVEHGLTAVTAETVERLAAGLGVPALYIYTFPEEDERTTIADLIIDFPTRELVSLRKALTVRRKALSQEAETKASKRSARVAG